LRGYRVQNTEPPHPTKKKKLAQESEPSQSAAKRYSQDEKKKRKQNMKKGKVRRGKQRFKYWFSYIVKGKKIGQQCNSPFLKKIHGGRERGNRLGAGGGK